MLPIQPRHTGTKYFVYEFLHQEIFHFFSINNLKDFKLNRLKPHNQKFFFKETYNVYNVFIQKDLMRILLTLLLQIKNTNLVY